MILNLTQHNPTADQMAAGVINPAEETWAAIKQLITFDELPPPELVVERAQAVATIAAEAGAERAMIGGASFFMAPLERALRALGITPVYAFTRRQAVDLPQPDGSVKKTQVFVHAGFVEAV